MLTLFERRKIHGERERERERERIEVNYINIITIRPANSFRKK